MCRRKGLTNFGVTRIAFPWSIAEPPSPIACNTRCLSDGSDGLLIAFRSSGIFQRYSITAPNRYRLGFLKRHGAGFGRLLKNLPGCHFEPIRCHPERRICFCFESGNFHDRRDFLTCPAAAYFSASSFPKDRANRTESNPNRSLSWSAASSARPILRSRS